MGKGKSHTHPLAFHSLYLTQWMMKMVSLQRVTAPISRFVLPKTSLLILVVNSQHK